MGLIFGKGFSSKFGFDFLDTGELVGGEPELGLEAQIRGRVLCGGRLFRCRAWHRGFDRSQGWSGGDVGFFKGSDRLQTFRTGKAREIGAERRSGGKGA